MSKPEHKQAWRLEEGNKVRISPRDGYHPGAVATVVRVLRRGQDEEAVLQFAGGATQCYFAEQFGPAE